MVSKWNSLQHQREVCHRQFPDGSSSGLLPDWPAAAETNADLGGWAIRPSNVYWSGGEFDPWRTLSPLSTEPFAPDYTATQQVPACGVKTSASTLFGYTLPNSEHCFDFRNAAHSADSRKNFTNALAEWLRCFPGRV